MIRHISFEKTPNFKSISHEVMGKAIFDFQVNNQKEYEGEPLDLPTVEFHGTEKIHGTNAAVCYNNIDGLWVQSRNNVIKIGEDNCGCAQAVANNEAEWLVLINHILIKHNIDLDAFTLTIYYEWAGGNIQGDNCAVSGSDKKAFIFAYARVSDDEGHLDWVDTKGISNDDCGIHNITDYPSYHITVNFNELERAQELLDSITFKMIEPKSPVGTHFNLDNVGEGAYYIAKVGTELIRFKHKGDAHGGKPKKKKTQEPINDARVQLLTNVAEQITPVWRLTQGITETGASTMKDFGTLLKWIVADIEKEESHMFVDIEYKEVHKYVVACVKSYFTETIGV